MVCECGPDFVFLFFVCVISFALYLLVKFVKARILDAVFVQLFLLRMGMSRIVV